MSAFMLILGIFSGRLRKRARHETEERESNSRMSARAITELYRDYSGLVFRRALHFVRDETEAEECMHDIFCKVIERSDQFEGRSSPSTWLYQITTRHCLNVIRDSNRQRQLIDLYIRPWFPSAEESDHESRELLEVAWSHFNDELRQVCTYHYIDGLSRDEVGRIMGCTGRTVGNRIDEIRAILNQLQGASV